MTGTHKHKCDSCGNVWEHSDDMAGNQEAHTCQCGEKQFYHYYENEEERRAALRKSIHGLFNLLFHRL